MPPKSETTANCREILSKEKVKTKDFVFEKKLVIKGTAECKVWHNKTSRCEKHNSLKHCHKRPSINMLNYPVKPYFRLNLKKHSWILSPALLCPTTVKLSRHYRGTRSVVQESTIVFHLLELQTSFRPSLLIKYSRIYSSLNTYDWSFSSPQSFCFEVHSFSSRKMHAFILSLFKTNEWYLASLEKFLVQNPVGDINHLEGCRMHNGYHLTWALPRAQIHVSAFPCHRKESNSHEIVRSMPHWQKHLLNYFQPLIT